MTSAGFSFLFKPLAAQVWDVIIAYMDSLAARNMNRREVLVFLFRLSFLNCGSDYDTLSLTDSQRALIADLSHFGLIYQTKKSSSRYYPTRLALNLASSTASKVGAISSTSAAAANATSAGGGSGGGGGGVTGTGTGESDGFLVLETTFKLYALNPTPFQVSLLKLFVRFEYQLPNMV